MLRKLTSIHLSYDTRYLVDGGWSDWLAWEPCSATCGTAERARRRLCDNPVPENGGVECQGERIILEICDMPSCPGKLPEAAKIDLRKIGVVRYQFYLEESHHALVHGGEIAAQK